MVYTVVALTTFVLVLRLKTVNAASAIELTSEHLICLDESLKLTSKISVLSLQALSVLFKGVAFGEHVAVVGSVLRVGNAEAFNVATHGKQSVFFLLQTKLRITDLD